MSTLRVPIVSVVIGEGGSGGALAIGVCDRLLMLQFSTYSVISPEGCASILWKSADKKEVAAEALNLTADRLRDLGLVDEVLPEPLGGAHRDPAAMSDDAARAPSCATCASCRHARDAAARAAPDAHRLLRGVHRERAVSAARRRTRRPALPELASSPRRGCARSCAHWPGRCAARAVRRLFGGLDSTVAAGSAGSAARAQRLRAAGAARRSSACIPIRHSGRGGARAGAPLAGALRAAASARFGSMRGESLEAAARAARYAALSSALTAQELLLTAHHQEDQLETVLLALLRGSGVRGLAAMSAAQLAGRAPAAAAVAPGDSRAELARFATDRKLVWIEDPSNADQRFDRNLSATACAAGCCAHAGRRWQRPPAAAPRTSPRRAAARRARRGARRRRRAMARRCG